MPGSVHQMRQATAENEGKGEDKLTRSGSEIMNSESAARPHFMDLPQETRDNVYHYLWMERPNLLVPADGVILRVQYSPLSVLSAKTGHTYLPSWLRTSKAMLHEGLKQLSLNAEWSAGLLSKSHTKKSSPLASPSLASKMVFQVDHLKANAKGRKWTLIKSLLPQAERVLTKSSSLKSLAIKFWFLDTKYCRIMESNWHQWWVDLSFLDAVKVELQELIFSVAIAWPPVDCVEIYTTYWQALEEELRVGGLLAGENGRVEVEEVAGSDSSNIFPSKVHLRYTNC